MIPQRQRQLHGGQHQDQAQISVDEAEDPHHRPSTVGCTTLRTRAPHQTIGDQHDLIQRNDERRGRQDSDEDDGVQKRALPPSVGPAKAAYPPIPPTMTTTAVVAPYGHQRIENQRPPLFRRKDLDEVIGSDSFGNRQEQGSVWIDRGQKTPIEKAAGRKPASA